MYWLPVWKQIGWKQVGKSLSRVTVRAVASVGAELAGEADAGAAAEADGAVDVAGVWPPHAETKIRAIAIAAARIRMVLLLQTLRAGRRTTRGWRAATRGYCLRYQT